MNSENSSATIAKRDYIVLQYAYVMTVWGMDGMDMAKTGAVRNVQLSDIRVNNMQSCWKVYVRLVNIRPGGYKQMS
jgi:hypothetical protein